jgi:hypothetical protein
MVGFGYFYGNYDKEKKLVVVVSSSNKHDLQRVYQAGVAILLTFVDSNEALEETSENSYSVLVDIDIGDKTLLIPIDGHDQRYNP